MPEIAEVARVVHYLRTHLRNRTIASVITTEDDNVYGKVGTSSSHFEKALTGRTILDARRQGKYWWLVLDQPPHPLCHFSMTGWMKLTNVETGYYRSKADEKAEDKAKGKSDVPDAVYNNAGSTRQDEQEWPPRFWKFVLKMQGDPPIEAAFVDARRFARIRLIDVPADEMRKTSPLKENGPDPLLDKDILTEEWLSEKLKSKRVPVKALLLDQACISGIGNWVGDEILHDACVHPEQYSNTLTDDQCRQLHKSLMYVCDTACELLGDSDQYPEHWLFRHRWNKGKKDVNLLPNGEKIVHLTVGGRTSAIVPSRQKKTGPVAGDVEAEKGKGAKSKKRKSSVKGEEEKDRNEDDSETQADVKRSGSIKIRASAPISKKDTKPNQEPKKLKKSKRESTTKGNTKPATKDTTKAEGGLKRSRRSVRKSGQNG